MTISLNKVRFTVHVIAQLLAQGAVIALVHGAAKPYFDALLAIIGVMGAAIDDLYVLKDQKGLVVPMKEA